MHFQVIFYFDRISCKLISFYCIVKEVITPNVKYCAPSFNLGPMPAIYSSIPIICYDTFLVILATAVLVKHLKEQKEIKMKPNTYVLMIVRYHIIYFVLRVPLCPVNSLKVLI
jgi:hypothetical protein